jgi:hypothetical protein
VMATVVVGGHTRNVGKTSVVAGLIAAMPEHNWTAIKITQYGHGICSVNGKQCHCAVDDHRWAITEERDRSGASDTSRFLVAGAQRSLWVRTKQGRLSEAMPGLRRKLASTENTIIESNSVLGFLQPDVYLTVLDSGTQDFKASARKFLELADAVILHDFAGERSDSAWPDIPAITIAQKPAFHIRPPHYVTPEIVEFVRQKIGPLHAQV